MGIDVRSFWCCVTTGSRTETAIGELIEPAIEDLGFELVRVQLMAAPRRTLQIMVEPADHAQQMTVEHCEEISHLVSALLDVEDPIGGSYNLEVSSPGLDRPLVKREHFDRFRGLEARVETFDPVEGQKRFRGRLGGVIDDEILLDVDGRRRNFAFDNVKKAKLVLNDELLAQAKH